jgi:hypothetical protein
MKRLGVVLNAAAVAAVLAAPRVAAAAEPTYVTAGAGGIYPEGAAFNGIDVQGLELALGSEIGPDGSGVGNFTVVLLGASPLAGEVRPITVEGLVLAGTRSAANVALLSGTATLDLGDGLPPAPDIPFTATLVRDAATAQGTLALVIGSVELPAATLNEGSVSIQTVPPEPLEDPLLVAGP